MNIKRQSTTRRMSQIVVHGSTVYLAGQVGRAGDPIEAQTREALARVDDLLTRSGSSREHLLQATIWLSNIDYFDAMNSVWDDWIPLGAAPTRACGEAKLADPGLFVEVIAVAALQESL